MIVNQPKPDLSPKNQAQYDQARASLIEYAVDGILARKFNDSRYAPVADLPDDEKRVQLRAVLAAQWGVVLPEARPQPEAE